MKDKQYPICIYERIEYTENKAEPEFSYLITGEHGDYNDLSYANLIAIRNLIDVITEKRSKEEQK